MNLSSVAKYASTAQKHSKVANKFATAVQDTKAGENISADSQELAGHVNEQFEEHTEAVEEAKNIIGNAFSKVTAAAAALVATAPQHSCTNITLGYVSHRCYLALSGTRLSMLDTVLERPQRKLPRFSSHHGTELRERIQV